MERERQGHTLKAHELLALLQRLLKLATEQLDAAAQKGDDAPSVVALTWFDALSEAPHKHKEQEQEDEEAALVQRLVRGSADALDTFVASAAPSSPSSLSTVTRVLGRVLVTGLDVLTHLVEPLLTYQAYDAFLLAMSIVEERERLSVLRTLLLALPSRYRALVTELIALLHRLACLRVHTTLHADDALAETLTALTSSFIRPYKLVYYMEADKVLQRALVATLVAHAPHMLPSTSSPAQLNYPDKRTRPEWLVD